MSLQQRLSAAFQARHASEPVVVVRAPGRVNLIGEHTDYNDGFVMPMAIDRAVWIALRPRSDRRVSVYSLDFDQAAEFDLDRLAKNGPRWLEYVRGVAWALQSNGYALSGWEGVLAGDVPRGAGLSSSAAVELATARAFAELSGWAWQPAAMARLCQLAENQWVGVNCGIMDQMISAAGQAGNALLIDCRSLETESVPLPPGTAVVVLDTATRRGLVDSAYNERRAQCQAAARAFGAPALRDVSVEAFERRAAALDELARRRARHVVTENARVLAARQAMAAGEAAALGQLLNQSHASLRDDFEVSNRELDIMAACAQAHPACHGARMTGAGFGGCAVALVRAEAAGAFAAEAARAYEQQAGRKPALYVCQATDGASVV